jgi:NTE family protein
MTDVLNIACLSGGDTRGAFQAGALDGLTRAGILFHGYIGTSTGALHGGFLSQADGTLEGQAAQIGRLEEIWFGLRDRSDILGGGLLSGIIRALTFRPSLTTLAPLAGLLERHIVEPPTVPVWLGVVSLETGLFRSWRPGSVGELRTAILASASTPVVLEPVSAEGLVDGGVREISPLAAAFEHARELKRPGQRVRIWLIQGFPMSRITRPVRPGIDWRKRPLWQVALRTLQIANHETMKDDEEHALRINELVAIFERHPELSRPAWLRDRIHADVVRIECSGEDAPYDMFEVKPDLIRHAWRRGVQRGSAAAGEVLR